MTIIGDFFNTLMINAEVNHKIYGAKILRLDIISIDFHLSKSFFRHDYSFDIVLLVNSKEITLARLTLDTDFKKHVAVTVAVPDTGYWLEFDR